jgi:hypothetical protein
MRIGQQRFDAQGVLAAGRSRAVYVDNIKGIAHILDRGGSQGTSKHREKARPSRIVGAACMRRPQGIEPGSKEFLVAISLGGGGTLGLRQRDERLIGPQGTPILMSDY